MRCQSCDVENLATSTYCERCGARLFTACPRCGRQASPLALFCGFCGSALENNPDVGRLGAPSLTAIASERKQATILFADIVASTQLIAGLDPEEAIERLRPSLALMRPSVERFGGSVVRTMGDGILALFGAPRANEGHAVLACSAALAMQEAIARAGAPPIRVGLHSGMVVSGVPSAHPTGEAAQGVAIHLASRMQAIAEPGSICITSDCYRLVRGYCDVRPLGTRLIKGFAEPVEVYQLLARRPAIASEQFRGAVLTPFRGRAAELSVLRRALESTEQGQAKVIGISAPPGIGKSRLCYEFGEWCRQRPIPVIEARALTYGHATPFQPVLELLRSFFRILPGDESIAARGRIARLLLGLDPRFEADLPLVNDFLGVGDAQKPAPRLDPATRLARLRDVVRRMVRLAGMTTSVIIFEDLHWLDEASREFVETIVDAVADTRTMLLLTFRPSYSASWMSQAHYSELSLAELGSEPIRELVEELIGADPNLQEIRDRVGERSGGNPFFAEELINSLTDSGALTGEPGQYRLQPGRHKEDLPATVQAVVGARIDRIGERDKAVLQIGAIIGEEFPLAVVQQVAEVSPDEMELSLNRLCGVELIQRQVGVDPRQFAFRHPLIREVAYTTQLKTRRTAMHASVARALEAFYKDRLDEFAGLLAHHYEAAGQLLQASRFTERAANWVGKTDAEQALKYWKKVRLLLQELPKSVQNDRHRINACGRILHFGWRGREGMTAEEAKPYAEEALRLAAETGDRMVQTLVLVGYGRNVVASGPADDYVAIAKEALALISETEDRTVTLEGILSQAYLFAGLLNEALETNTHALERAPGIDKVERHILGYDVEHWIICLRARILVLLGRFAEARDWLEKAIPLEGAQVNPVVHFIPHVAFVEFAWAHGDAALAAQHAARVTQMAEHSAISYLQVIAAACAGLAKSTAGEYLEAVEQLTRAIDLARRAKAGREYEARMLADLADAHCRAGDPSRAAAVAKEAIELSQRRTARAAECHATITLAAALAAMQDAVDPRLIDRAEELLGISGARIYEPLLSHVRDRIAVQAGSRVSAGPAA